VCAGDEQKRKTGQNYSVSSIEKLFLSQVPVLASSLLLPSPPDVVSATFVLTGLSPSTSYNVFCSTLSSTFSPRPLSLVLNSQEVVWTGCCRLLEVRLNRLQFDNASDTPFALTINIGSSEVEEELRVVISASRSASPSSPSVVKSPFSPSEATFSSKSSVSSVGLAYVHNEILKETGRYLLNVRVLGTSGSAYEVSFPAGSEFVVRAFSDPVPGPMMRGVWFSSDGSKILIEFVDDTNQGGSLRFETDCSNFFQLYISGSPTSLSDSGSGIRCVWVDAKRVEMSGSSYQLNIGDVIELKPNVLKAACGLKDSSGCGGWPFTVRHNKTLSAPEVSSPPVVRVSIPSLVGACSGLDVDLSSSSGSGGREWKSLRIQVSISSLTVAANSSTSLSLEEYLSTRIQSSVSLKSLLSVPIHISSEHLSVGCVHSFEIVLCNFLSSCGRTVKTFQVSASESIPTVSLTPSTLVTMSRNSSLLISGAGSVSSCVNANANGGGQKSSGSLTYLWGLYENEKLLDSVDMKSMSVNPLQFKLPSYRLRAGSLYVVKLTVTHRLSSQSSSNSVQVFVGSGGLVCSISSSPTPSSSTATASLSSMNSKLSLRANESLSLDWSKSYDENDFVPSSGVDWVSRLSFSWDCFRVFPTYLANCQELLVFSLSSPSRVTITVNSTSFALTQSSVVAVGDTFQVSLRGSSVKFGDDRHCERSFDVEIVDNRSPLVSLSIVGGLSSSSSSGSRIKINPSSKLKVVGTVESRSRGHALWSIDNPAIPASSSLSPTSVSVAGSLSAQTMSFILSKESLQSLSSSHASSLSFVLTLSCVLDNGLSLSSSLTIETNSPPQLCEFEVSPVVGKMLQTKFLMSSRCVDEDLPLSYQFGYSSMDDAVAAAVVADAMTMVVLRSKMELSYASTTLPSGSRDSNFSLSCLARVFDALESSSLLSSEAIVQAVSSTLDDLFGYVWSGLNESMSTSDADQLKTVIASSAKVLNEVNCSLAPASRCQWLNRKRCGSVSGSCGECVIGSVGATGPSNTPCVLIADLETRRTLGTLLTESDTKPSPSSLICNSDDDCEGGLFLECDLESSRCQLIQQSCPNSCSGHGSCQFVWKYDPNVTLSRCGILDVDCRASCVCDEGYLGTACSTTETDFDLALEMRHTLLIGTQALMALENMDVTSIVSVIQSLSSLSPDLSGLSDRSKALMCDLCLDVLEKSLDLGLSFEDLSGLERVIDVVLSISSNSTTASDSRSAEIQARSSLVLRTYRDLMVGDMLEGQNAVEMISSLFRTTAFSVSPSSKMQFSSPMTLLESLSLSANQSRSPNSVSLLSTVSSPIRFSLMETESETVIGEGKRNVSKLSNPFSVVFYDRPCAGLSLENGGDGDCLFQVELSNHLSSRSSANSSFISESIFEAECILGEIADHVYLCPSHHELTIHCNGTFSGIGQQRCPMESPSAVCQSVSGGGFVSCELDSYSESSTRCVCRMSSMSPTHRQRYRHRRLSASSGDDSESESASEDDGAVEFSVQSLARSVLMEFVSTWRSTATLSASDVRKGWLVLSTIISLGVIFFCLIVIAMLCDLYESKIQSQDTNNAHSPIRQMAKRGSLRRRRVVGADSQSHSPTIRSSDSRMTMLDDSLPLIFRSDSFWSKFKQEMRVYHRWLGVLFYFSPEFPRSMRVLSLFSSIVIMLFIQSVTYNIADPDDGSCEACESAGCCLSLRSTLNWNEDRCSWDEWSLVTNSSSSDSGEDGSCSFRAISGDITRIFTVTLLSAILCAPLTLLVQYLISNILSAPTATASASDRRVLPRPRSVTLLSDQSAEISESIGNCALSNFKNLLDDLERYMDQLRDLPSSRSSSPPPSLPPSSSTSPTTLVTVEEMTNTWGPILERQLGLDSHSAQEVVTSRDVSLRLISLATSASNLAKSSEPVTQRNLLKELSAIRREVCEEYLWLRDGIDKLYLSPNSAAVAKGKRLMHLFLKDLASGLSGDVLGNKSQRDSLTTGSACLSGRSASVKWSWKVLGWVLVVLSNGGMLFYVYLFALNQTEERQSAWFRSFMLWFAFDFIIASTGAVAVTHLLIPLYVMSDIRTIKRKVLGDIVSYREKQLLVRRKVMAAAASGVRRSAACSAAPSVSLRSPEAVGQPYSNSNANSNTQSSDPSHTNANTSRDSNNNSEFNAAKYLFTSWRVAALLPDLPESQLVLQFQTPWPKKSFRREKTKVAKTYERKYSFLIQAVSRVAIFFLSSLLHVPLVIQDMVIHLLSTSGLGYLSLLLLRLTRVSPLLPLAPLFGVAVIIHFFIRSGSSVRGRALEEERLRQQIHPILCEDEVERESDVKDERGNGNDNRETQRRESQSGADVGVSPPHVQSQVEVNEPPSQLLSLEGGECQVEEELDEVEWLSSGSGSSGNSIIIIARSGPRNPLLNEWSSNSGNNGNGDGESVSDESSVESSQSSVGTLSRTV
jgi:hypothetical protein